MPYTTGPSKSLVEITIEDVLADLIWEKSSGEEGNEGQDETWQRPITGIKDVSTEIEKPIITLVIEGTGLNATGEYDRRSESINSIRLWYEEQWLGLHEIPLPLPVTFVSLPTINGIENVKFVSSHLSNDRVYRTK